MAGARIALCRGPDVITAPSGDSLCIWTLVTFGDISRSTSGTLTTLTLASVGKRKALGHRAELATPEAISSVAARNFGASASVMRPTSPYLNAPPLAHSTTSPMA